MWLLEFFLTMRLYYMPLDSAELDVRAGDTHTLENEMGREEAWQGCEGEAIEDVLCIYLF